MKSFLIYVNLNKDPELSAANALGALLESKGLRAETYIDEELRPGVALPENVHPVSDPAQISADCVFVLGGDGTMLAAARRFVLSGIPLIGVNYGTIGYMAEIEPADLESAIERLVQGEYCPDNRMMLDGQILFQSGTKRSGYALNDIVISRRGEFKLIKLIIRVNGAFLCHYCADGVIVSTPTGSTGYSFSAGGPVIEPRAELIMLTPICPHSLNNRSVILAPEDQIEILIPEGRDGKIQTVEVNFDGAETVPLQTGDKIVITRSAKRIVFLKVDQSRSFLETLQRKLPE